MLSVSAWFLVWSYGWAVNVAVSGFVVSLSLSHCPNCCSVEGESGVGYMYLYFYRGGQEASGCVMLKESCCWICDRFL